MLEHESDCRPLPVRLCDIRAAVRYSAAQRIAATEPAAGPEVLHAALFPSETVYWVNEDALMTLLQVQA